MTAPPPEPASGVPVPDAAFDAAAYAACTAHHRAHDETALAGVSWAPGLRVVDLGCGVGDLTARVADLVAAGDGPGAGSVVGVDASAGQLALAERRARPGLAFRRGRAQELEDVVPAGWADVVLSVATLHWVPAADQPAVHAQVSRALAAGGRFRLDMGGAGQIADARAVIDEVAAAHGLAGAPWFFPDEATATDLIVGAGLEPVRVELLHQERPMPDAATLEGWLRSQVLPGYTRLLPAEPAAAAADSSLAAAFSAAAVAACQARLRRADGGYAQRYVRLDALARRPARS